MKWLLWLPMIICVALGVGLAIDRHDPKWTEVHRATSGIVFLGLAVFFGWLMFYVL